MSKYSIPVYIQTWATHGIGTVECDSVEEFKEKAEALWESQQYEQPTTNIHNEFELGDTWEIPDMDDSDLQHYIEEWPMEEQPDGSVIPVDPSEIKVHEGHMRNTTPGICNSLTCWCQED